MIYMLTGTVFFQRPHIAKKYDQEFYIESQAL